jgi:hypothetical protein
LPFALPLSYSSFRPWRDLNPHPVIRCNSHLHHAAKLSNFKHTSSARSAIPLSSPITISRRN